MQKQRTGQQENQTQKDTRSQEPRLRCLKADSSHYPRVSGEQEGFCDTPTLLGDRLDAQWQLVNRGEEA